MEKDNSISSKSQLKTQIEILNEIVAKRNISIENAIRYLGKQQKRHKDMIQLLKLYSDSILSLNSGYVVSTKKMTLVVKDYIEFAEYEKKLKENSSNEIKQQITDDISQKMRDYIQSLIDELSEITNLNFIIVSQEDDFYCEGLDNFFGQLSISRPCISFIIDIM